MNEAARKSVLSAPKPGTPDDAKTAIVVDEVFPHGAAIIWRAITTGSLMARWMMEPQGFAPSVGNRFHFQTNPAGKWDGRILCEVLEVVPERRFVFTWQSGDAANVGYGAPLDSIVTFTLAPATGGTRLSVVHAGFVLPRNETAYRNMSGGWVKCVAKLGDVAQDRKAGDEN